MSKTSTFMLSKSIAETITSHMKKKANFMYDIYTDNYTYIQQLNLLNFPSET